MATEDECLEALLEAAERLGESPTKAQYEELELTPVSGTILRACGGWNDAKEMVGLETSYSRGPRVAPKPDDIEFPPETSSDELSVDQRWQYRNVDHNTERTLLRRSRLRSWVNERMQQQGCSQCGVDALACLDFHHVDESAKKMAVG
ncbi:homing endonuclease associated repeat-containing protein [Natrinema halophilum]|uniref:homing endonuclease associated repeat-containing protein n=1 Tax=Natrinema halophilum TaxID=1699371 RepID=UPI0031BA4446